MAPSHPYSSAVLAQLSAEFAANDLSVKQVAERLGKDYNTFRRYMTGERPMPVDVLFEALEVIDLEPREFISRAEQRVRPAAE